jgi:hypothetical protein
MPQYMIIEIIDLEFNHLKRDGSLVLHQGRSGSETGLSDAKNSHTDYEINRLNIDCKKWI